MKTLLNLFFIVACFAVSKSADASYQMFCELKGEVVTAEQQESFVRFKFRIDESRDIQLEGLGSGATDCHQLIEEEITIVLDFADAGNRSQIVPGARLSLERYEIDVYMNNDGQPIRSITHIRTDS